MRLVLDNSVSMRWLFGDGGKQAVDYANHVLDVLEMPEAEVMVPAIWSLEVANVIARAEAKALLTEARSSEFIGLLQEMNIRIDASTSVHALDGSLQLARRFGLSAYDASYLELSLREGLPLATLDTDLRRAMKKTGVKLA
ncbi:MAG: type II toxin-antitoxin system VapC family toxin [Chromatiales bacterium]|jgi:predicted nucleic acid-binding protein|nr:type II toxin-antitoxin system VapC family toxin [Chromatiales bacterium]MDX9766810.1 type II toxin-antitoxin system VapC family toxin [Ectothiorhodospiraceae bacterium]